MFNPIASYRIQFNKEFTFKQLDDQLEFFFLLGPGAIYASPVFEAVPGSMHGYNVTNANALNPEIGKYTEFTALSDKLKEKGMGWIQDIVPNHMAFDSKNNWLFDVLEKGVYSKYAGYFDIDYEHPGLQKKLMAPFLGKTVTEAVNEGEIKLQTFKGSFVFRYFDNLFPVNFTTFQIICQKYLQNTPFFFYQILE
ncbi:MAG: hypothetical protein HC906_11145 [Bacteroidales bacterium]|nr:hypothetical protein [Bacteroidales bacterium]